MMREFTKSIFSFSWAMSLFGLRQATNLMSPEETAGAFNSVTEATEGQLTDVLKATFNVGDKLQRSAVDTTLGMFGGEALDPNKLMRMASDAAKQSAEVVTKGVQGVTSTVQQATSATSQGSGAAPAPAAGTGSASTASQRQGWGPMPS